MRVIIQLMAGLSPSELTGILDKLPRKIPGVEETEWLVLEDGSSDEIARVAQAHGADHIVRVTHSRGPATVFRLGVEACLDLGADIIISGESPAPASSEIPKLILPLVRGEADVTLACEPGREDYVTEMRRAWRGFTRDSAARLKQLSGEATYPVQTVLEASSKGMLVKWVPLEGIGRGSWRARWRARAQYLAAAFDLKPFPFFAAAATIALFTGFGAWTFALLVAGVALGALSRQRRTLEDLDAKFLRLRDAFDHCEAAHFEPPLNDYLVKPPNAPPEIN